MENHLHRRNFLKLGMGLTVVGLFGLPLLTHANTNVKRLPRWRGFNLLEKFNGDHNQPFVEKDFQMIAGLGFDFVRLPMSYHCWSRPDNWLIMNEEALKEIDQAVAYGNKYKVHVNLNLHRIPGYCVNPPTEPLNLWKDDKALDAAVFHWRHFAKRYKGISSKKLSFDLINEPSNVTEADYVRVISRIVDAIRFEDPARLIIIDGMQYGTQPVFGLINKNLGQSARGYAPMHISHFKASWIKGSENWAVPAWPLQVSEKDVWDKSRLIKDVFDPWKKLAATGTGVHVGEWGAFNYTPHQVTLAWMKDNLEIWKENGWGWSLWNFRGAFGILDSNRKDVDYEDYQGHQLDRKMLDLLRSY